MPSGTRSQSPRAEAREALAEAFLDHLKIIGKRFRLVLSNELLMQIAQVTPHQIEAVALLCGHPDGMTMNDIARQQQCAVSTATALADRLVAQDLVERVPDADDRRVVRLVPTARAQQLMQKARATKRELGLSLLSTLSDDEAAQLVGLLGRLAEMEEARKDG